tara:strand:+ start:7007 stop:7834 length:828 start_codon:yes stop_codon:yes gene_type:complete
MGNMSVLPKISVVIPSFNQCEFIEETFLSVISQNYPNIEIIVIDGGSTDKSIDIILKYKDNFKFWISEKDNGQSHAINKGFEKSTGDIVTWLCSDDTYLPNSLNIVADYFIKNPDLDFLYGNVISIDENSKELKKIRNIPFTKLGFLNSIGAIPQPASFYRKTVLIKSNMLAEDMDFFMDYDLFARMILSGAKFKSINNLLATYRYHNKSKTINSKINIRKHNTDRTKILKIYSEKLGVNYSLVKFSKPIYFIARTLLNIDKYLLRSLNKFTKTH